MDLKPLYQMPFQLPEPWPLGAEAILEQGGWWLHSGDRGDGLLAFPGPALRTRWSPSGWVSHRAGRAVEGSPWVALADCVSGGRWPWVGAATFELACDEAGLPRKPLAHGTLGQQWAPLLEALSIQGGRAELWSWGEAPPDPAPWTRLLEVRSPPPPPKISLQSAWRRARHQAAVEEIQRRILDGEFYVANLCVPFEGAFQGSPAALGRAAFQRACPPFGAALSLDGLFLLSLSMERLLARRGPRIWSQPIKGSTPLTGDATQDAAAAAALAADPKERAEHTMILDLVRNDLGRIAETGSVRVSKPMAVEPFPTVQHLVSTVEGTARQGLGLPELLRAVLPGGSVTGAPKHAVCAHLAEVEAAPRGFYCGAVGWITPDGDLDFALPIRTAQIVQGGLTYWAGGGITRRSQPTREWEELAWKTRVITG